MSVYRTIGPLVFFIDHYAGVVSNKHCLLPFFFIFNWIFFILAGIEDMHESLDEFEFQQICNRVTALD